MSLEQERQEALNKIKFDNAELKRERDKFLSITAKFDFTSLKDGKSLLKHLGDNATLWATAFEQMTQKMIDEKKLDKGYEKDYMVQWFASAIEHSWKLRKWREESEPKDEKRVRHKKRDSTYNVVGEAELQLSSPVILEEGRSLTVYRSEKDGKLWVRPSSEFNDGRFEEIGD